jgi:hypothetical protein
MPHYFHLNEANVSAEVFDTEVLSINLLSGHYYSLRESAIPLWRLIIAGHSLEQAAALLASSFQVPPEIALT